jgi:hypothetical protein
MYEKKDRQTDGRQTERQAEKPTIRFASRRTGTQKQAEEQVNDQAEWHFGLIV